MRVLQKWHMAQFAGGPRSPRGEVQDSAERVSSQVRDDGQQAVASAKWLGVELMRYRSTGTETGT